MPGRGSGTTSTTGPKPAAISALRSLEPLSTTISWSQGRLWASTLSIASARYASPLRTGIAAVTSGSAKIGHQAIDDRGVSGGVRAELERVTGNAADEVGEL